MGVNRLFIIRRQTGATVQAGTPMTVHEDGGAVRSGGVAFIFVP
jgi:hypothetical protein